MTYVASLLLLLAWIVTLVFYMAYGPRSVIIGFVFGVGLTAFIAWLGFKYPGLLAMADSRSDQSLMVGAVTKNLVASSDNPHGTVLLIGRVFGWLLTIFAGGATLLFATFAIALRLRGELTSGMVGSAVLCGMCLVFTVISFKYIARVGLS